MRVFSSFKIMIMESIVIFNEYLHHNLVVKILEVYDFNLDVTMNYWV